MSDNLELDLYGRREFSRASDHHTPFLPGSALASHRDDPPASREAAAKAAPNAAAQREQILTQLQKAGARGHIAEELDLLFDWHTPSGSPSGKRLSELLRENPPRVERLAETRLTSTESKSHVHVLPEFVRGRDTLPPRERTGRK